MIDYSLAQQAEETWLNNLVQFVKDSGIHYVHQACDISMDDAQRLAVDGGIFLLAPCNSIDEDPDEDGHILLKFDIIATTAQEPDGVLVAHRANNILRQVIENALFSPQRIAQGYMTEGRVYTLPLLSFDDQGQATQVPGGLFYQRSAWFDQSPPTSPVRQWVLSLTVSVET